MWWLLAPLAFAAARPVSPDYEGNCQSPAWAPDGVRLTFEVNYHERKSVELYVVNITQNAPLPVRPTSRSASGATAGFSTTATESAAIDVSWAPRAIGRFVYSAAPGNRDFDLYIDGGGALAASPGVDGNAAWSPDGKRIAFTSARTGEGDLYLLDLAAVTTPPRRLTTVEHATELFAAWSPDSRSLVYVGRSASGDNLGLITDLANPVPRALTDWPHTQTRPRWSPDGRLIAFYSNREQSNRFDLLVMPAEGGAATVLARGVVLNPRGPAWSPDGTRIVFVKDDDDRYDPVWSVPVSDPSRAKPLETGTVGNGDLDVIKGADGKVWLAVAAQGMKGDKVRDFKRIYVVDIAP